MAAAGSNPSAVSTRDVPLISLVIPTRERADTLAHTLATALAQRSRHYEVVVSDNASVDHTRETVTRIADDRVRYFNTGERLSMCGNYEFALQQCVVLAVALPCGKVHW